MSCVCKICSLIRNSAYRTLGCNEIVGCFITVVFKNTDKNQTPYCILGKYNYEQENCNTNSSRVGKYGCIGEKMEEKDNGCYVNLVQRALFEEFCIEFTFDYVRDKVLGDNIYSVDKNALLVVAKVKRLNIIPLNEKLKCRKETSKELHLTEMDNIQIFRLSDVICGYVRHNRIIGFEKDGRPKFDETQQFEIHKDSRVSITKYLSMQVNSGFGNMKR